ncbi:uncharacterized protein JCM15063_000676 [Sporobolomyces koalae]|uniref:uncharacterized protein n=1 Tax=Sporobolomyces koalae TaxID=500713 RepID=UPI00317B7984
MGPTRNDFAARVLKAHAGQQQRVLVRQQLDCELRKYLDKLGALEEQLDGGGPWQRIWALDGSSIGASSDQIAVFAQLTDRDEAHYSPYNVVTPSALLISTLDSIMASREPSDEDLQLLVAFYWLEHDSQTVLTPGTFVDPNQLERLMTLPSSSNPWHFVSVAERRRAWSVKLKSYEIFERLKVISTKYFKGRFVLGFLLQVVTGKSSDPVSTHSIPLFLGR